MRRAYALLAVPMTFIAAAVAGCGSSAPPNPNQSVSVSGTFNATPKVTIPTQKATTSLITKTLIKGNGAALPASAPYFYGNFALYDWSGTTHKLLGSTYGTGKSALFLGQMIPGLSSALKGATVGTRVLAVIPPKDGFGTSGNSQIGVKGTDTLVYIVDVTKPVSNSASGAQVSTGGGSLPTVSTPAAGKAPTVTIPKTAAPKNLVVKDLIQGTGPKVAKGQYIAVQYVGVNYRTGQTFDSSWSRSTPFETPIGVTPSQVIPGWDKGLVGQSVGSRVLLVIPPADGYGKSGNSQAGIKGTDTLVFVVDILAAVSP